MNFMKIKIAICFIFYIFFIKTACAVSYYGEKICHTTDYICYQVNTTDTWDGLFPDFNTKDLLQRINRMNMPLKNGMILAIPKTLDNISAYDISPFSLHINGFNEKVIFINKTLLAWAAYDEQGELVWWGPISSGMNTCTVKSGCNTPNGEFKIIRKQGEDCISTSFPRNPEGENGGAAMPYCMHFFLGYALHGSEELPGYNASHGCVRLFIEDAKWLNEEFVDVPGGGMQGTRVIIYENMAS